MAKKRDINWLCNECGVVHNKWAGQCSSCQQWNTIVEFSEAKPTNASRVGYTVTKSLELVPLAKVDTQTSARICSEFAEFNRVVGGGMVPGSSILIGGNPGAGKSTLLLQLLAQLSSKHSVVYVSGEESEIQIANRAKRLQINTHHVQLLIATNLEDILTKVIENKTKVVVIDSIQVMHSKQIESYAGSVIQIRECTTALVQFAKEYNVVVLIVGHITKDGNLAGPKVLEHIIDCFLMMDTKNDNRFRTITCHKNRYGATGEMGIFAMGQKGLIPVNNPSAIFLSRAATDLPGNVVTVLWEGTRAMLLEIQSLIASSNSGQGRHLSVGFDLNRSAMLLTILQRSCGLSLGCVDIYINIVGGIKIDEPSADLAVIMSMYSSFKNIVLPKNLICIGEVGLSGEVRPVSNGQQRLTEAQKHQFKYAIVPIGNKPQDTGQLQIQVFAVKGVAQAIACIQKIVQ